MDFVHLPTYNNNKICTVDSDVSKVKYSKLLFEYLFAICGGGEESYPTKFGISDLYYYINSLI